MAKIKTSTMPILTQQVGTYNWMAPEIMLEEEEENNGKGKYNHKADVYSFALVLYEMITGKIPFEGKNPAQIAALVGQKNSRPSISSADIDRFPPDLICLMQECWDRDPQRRPDFSVVMQKLDTFLGQYCSTPATRDTECIVCAEKNREVAFMPCAHMVCCSDCSEKFDHCCVCRKQILKRMRIYAV
eukprot:TRINITY_DN9649_c0_g1_i1.p1 TRINITY_DN9649_c0_g1~~TRINITY_DN9649_c0_g1_i1.p1  ORF type:complete len:187 (-),score=38.19 TRINITY_DN9649_c0_g1_i1:134-694(-)